MGETEIINVEVVLPEPPEGCAWIRVGQLHALVDSDMVEALSKHKWHIVSGYAMTNIRQPDGSWRSVAMHRIVNGTPDGLETDHINRERLDNRRCNLRTATRAQNARNVDNVEGSEVKYKGVRKKVRADSKLPYEARINRNGKRHSLGHFATAREAALVYDNAARVMFGEYAVLNFPEQAQEN